MKNKKYFKLVLIFTILAPLVIISLWLFYPRTLSSASSDVLGERTEIQKVMTLEELSKFNGDDPNLPIYIGLNGLVYDVSSGRTFYDKNGSYHYLAGKDSSSDLNMIGGDIILRKYKPIAKLSVN